MGSFRLTYPILDTTSWQEDIFEYGQGEREKNWIIEPDTNRVAMMKYTRTDRGEHWAEKLCSEFAKVLGFPCAQVELAVRNGKMGILSYFFVNKKEGYSHYDGGKFFPDEYDRIRNIGYTYQLIREVLTKPELNQYNLLENFLYIIVFDALVGSGDRHQDNWGITRHEKRDEMFISPLYDNSSCLGKEVTVEEATKYLHSRSDFLRYLHNAKSKIGWNSTRKERHFVLIRHLFEEFPHKMNELIQQVANLSDECIQRIVEELPPDVITDEQKQFVIQYVSIRRNILVRIGESMNKKFANMLMVWKDPDSRQRFVVGQLSISEAGFTFQYVNPALDEALEHGFKNYPSFPNLQETYNSTELFPSIVARLPNPRRADYPVILERFGLDLSSSQIEILEATRGRTPTDTFEFVKKLEYRPGMDFSVTFELAGARHSEFQTASDRLQVGTPVKLLKDLNNLFDPYAVRVYTEEETHIGYVPKYYSQEVTAMLTDVGDAHTSEIVRTDLRNESSDEWVRIRLNKA